MATERTSSYQPRVDYAREPEQQEVRRRQEEPAKPSPEQARAEAIANKPRPAVKTLGSRIDVYA